MERRGGERERESRRVHAEDAVRRALRDCRTHIARHTHSIFLSHAHTHSPSLSRALSQIASKHRINIAKNAHNRGDNSRTYLHNFMYVYRRPLQDAPLSHAVFDSGLAFPRAVVRIQPFLQLVPIQWSLQSL